MEPKIKAQELYDKMNVIHYVKLGGKNKNSKGLPVSMHKDQIKQCAIICVENEIETLEKIMKHFELSELHTSNSHRFICFKISQAKQVKHEIQQL